MESGFRTLYMDIQGNLSALVPLIRDEERVQLLHGMILQLSLYRENYVDAITSRAFIDRAIRNDLPALTDQITNQLNNSATINNNYEQLAQLVALSQLNLTAYAYRADAIDEEEILKSIMLVKQQIEQGMDDPETKASLLQPLNEYQNLINQVVSQTHNYLYLIKVILAGHANEYVYLSESLNTSIHNSFNLETENARQQLTLARRNTLVLSAALFLTIIASVLALALFLHRLAYLEKTLKDFSQRHKMIIDQANTGIAEVGLDGSWITVNKKLCEMFGYPEPELTSMSWQDITHPDDLATDAALVQQIINGEINQYTLDKRYIRKDGSFFWARLKVSGHKNSSGEPQNFISNIESIDDLKQKENLLLKTNTGLEKQVEERLRDLERSNAELEQFAYVASHDLQEPLRMVSSYMQLIEDRYRDKLDEDGKEFIQYAVDGALRMQTLIKSLLEYSRGRVRARYSRTGRNGIRSCPCQTKPGEHHCLLHRQLSQATSCRWYRETNHN
ncbi:MAG: sensor histidine kinase [Porticoccaceae bacterium]